MRSNKARDWTEWQCIAFEPVRNCIGRDCTTIVLSYNSEKNPREQFLSRDPLDGPQDNVRPDLVELQKRMDKAGNDPPFHWQQPLVDYCNVRYALVHNGGSPYFLVKELGHADHNSYGHNYGDSDGYGVGSSSGSGYGSSYGAIVEPAALASTVAYHLVKRRREFYYILRMVERDVKLTLRAGWTMPYLGLLPGGWKSKSSTIPKAGEVLKRDRAFPLLDLWRFSGSALQFDGFGDFYPNALSDPCLAAGERRRIALFPTHDLVFEPFHNTFRTIPRQERKTNKRKLSEGRSPVQEFLGSEVPTKRHREGPLHSTR